MVGYLMELLFFGSIAFLILWYAFVNQYIKFLFQRKLLLQFEKYLDKRMGVKKKRAEE